MTRSVRTFENAYHRLGALHAHAQILAGTLGDLSPEDVAAVLALAGITVGALGSDERVGELLAAIRHMEASMSGRTPPPPPRPSLAALGRAADPVADRRVLPRLPGVTS